jgi:deoxyribonuclease V
LLILLYLYRYLSVLICPPLRIAHPRGLGLASHLGLVLDVPTIGAAKSRLVGAGTEPKLEAGSSSTLIYQGKQVGFILRTQKGVRPLYLSPGHLITLAESRAITLGCVTKYRIPQPLRQADHLTRRLKTAALRAETL